MALSAGTRLGPYEILAPLGAGGMGEVYKARDTRLGRMVAVKTSREQFSDRFEREARAVAALNHPNICQLYDVAALPSGESYLVMEYVAGTPVAVVDSPRKLLDLAVQIADGLATAHVAGFVHRDMKPDNILVTHDGRVKILDFGLAKQTASPSQSDATLTIGGTDPGTVMGTVAYMSPEQARGQAVDVRSDQFSFGLILYEMACGNHAFKRPSTPETMTAIIREDAEPLPANVPAPVRWVIERCLAKEPTERYDSTRDLYRELRHARDHLSDTTVAPASPDVGPAKRRSLFLRLTAGAVLLAALAGAAHWVTWYQPVADQGAMHFSVAPPKDAIFQLGSAGGSAISPDGRLIAFVANSSRGAKLWLRPLESLIARELPGTEGALYPFWAPDCRTIAFFAAGKLKRVEISGGPPWAIADAAAPRGGTWNAGGTIIFSPYVAGGLYQVSASGGKLVPLTKLNPAVRETTHRWPQFLPDGRRFLYLSTGSNWSGIVFSSLDHPDQRIPSIESLSGASYTSVSGASEGRLLWVRGTSLMTQAFDPERGKLLGESVPVPVVNGVEAVPAYKSFTVSNTGTILYSREGDGYKLTWFDREGRALNEIGPLQRYNAVNLSPRGDSAAVSLIDPSGNRDIWKLDLARGVLNRVTREGRGWVGIWSPDGLTLACHLGNGTQLFRRNANGTGQEEQLLDSRFAVYVNDWSPDGRTLLYTEASTDTGNDLWLLSLGTGDRKPEPFLKTPAYEAQGTFSPDGKWVAYTSDESGQLEVYVQSIPPSGLKWPVSNNGGGYPRWRRDGKELFYRGLDGKLMAAQVRGAQRGLEFGTPVALFQMVEPQGPFAYPYDIARDGQRILALAPQERSTYPLTVLTNWQGELKSAFK